MSDPKKFFELFYASDRAMATEAQSTEKEASAVCFFGCTQFRGMLILLMAKCAVYHEVYFALVGTLVD